MSDITAPATDTPLVDRSLPDKEDHPAYPMRQDTGEEHDGMNWQRPTLQQPSVEVLHSNERPGLSAVFGTSVPPRGVSGMIRRFAFGFSESNMMHWVPLMLADRLQMVEADLADVARGKVPNLIKEWGWKARLKHDPKSVALAVGLATASVATAAYLVTRQRRR